MASKIRVAVLVENADFYNKEMLRGAYAATKELDEELIIFYGSGASKRSPLDNVMSHCNLSYEFVNVLGVDYALVPVSNIGLGSDIANEAFLEHLSVPIVALNYVTSHHSFVCYDNRAGVYEAMNYIIEKGKRKQIAIIAGPRPNNGTKQRVKAYKEALTEHGIKVDDDLILYANDYTSFNNEVIGPFLDKHPHLDALMCVTDRLAVCAYEELKKREYTVGHDILVAGFDDNMESSTMVPPLSSVHADAALLTYTATREGLTLLKGEDHFQKFIKTNFIPRASVGNIHSTDMDLYHFIEVCNDEKFDAEYLSWGIVTYIFDNKILFNNPLKEDMAAFLQFLLTKPADITSPSYTSEIYTYLSHLFTFENIHYIDLDKLITSVKVLFDIEAERDKLRTEQIEDLYQYLVNQLMISYNNIITNQEYTLDEKFFNINVINRVSMKFKEPKMTYELLGESLKLLHIKNASLLVFPHPETYHNSLNFPMPDHLIQKVRIRDGEIINTHNECFSMNDILDDFPGDHKIVSSISSNENQYGILITDLAYDDLSNVEYISSQFGTSLYMMTLLDQLNMTSVTDELTGLLNRRGILNEVSDTIAALQEDEYAYVLFADLDKLKEINDHYGHEGGDQALRMAAEILSTVFHQDVVGRIGGDEFVVLLKPAHVAFLQNIDVAIKQATVNLSLIYRYPFKVSISYGVSVFDHQTSKEDFKRILDSADKFMYERKKKNHEAG